MNTNRQMNNHTQSKNDAARANESADRRRPYHPPALTRHEKLPVITAGSISEEQWRFDSQEIE